MSGESDSAIDLGRLESLGFDREVPRADRELQDINSGRGGLREMVSRTLATLVPTGVRTAWANYGNTVAAMHRVRGSQNPDHPNYGRKN